MFIECVSSAERGLVLAEKVMAVAGKSYFWFWESSLVLCSLIVDNIDFFFSLEPKS